MRAADCTICFGMSFINSGRGMSVPTTPNRIPWFFCMNRFKTSQKNPKNLWMKLLENARIPYVVRYGSCTSKAVNCYSKSTYCLILGAEDGHGDRGHQARANFFIQLGKQAEF